MTFENMPQSDPRRIQLAWMRGWDDYPRDMPFNQQVSFPCELTLRSLPQGIVLCRYPVREIARIQDLVLSLHDYDLRPGFNPLASLTGELFAINLKIDLSQSSCSEVVLNLRWNQVTYNRRQHRLTSVGTDLRLEPRREPIEICVLMDRLSIETYVNQGEVSITNIAYQKDSRPHLELTAQGGDAKIVSLTVQRVHSIWR